MKIKQIIINNKLRIIVFLFNSNIKKVHKFIKHLFGYSKIQSLFFRFLLSQRFVFFRFFFIFSFASRQNINYQFYKFLKMKQKSINCIIKTKYFFLKNTISPNLRCKNIHHNFHFRLLIIIILKLFIII